MARKGGAPENMKPQKSGEPGHNPHGRPKKTIGFVNEELEKQGCKEASKQEIVGCYLRLINLTIPELTEMVNQADQPALIRIVGRAILSAKGFDVIERVIERGVGKADQTVTIQSTAKTINELFPPIDDILKDG